MRAPLQEWANSNRPSDDKSYKDGYWDQIIFVRDSLAQSLARRADHTYEEYRDFVKVCATHTSKSILLPVYELAWKRGVRFTLEYNFYFWTVSVESDRPLEWRFDFLFKPGDWAHYFYGIPEGRRFLSFQDNPSQFSATFACKYDLYAFILLVAQQFPDPVAEGGAA